MNKLYNNIINMSKIFHFELFYLLLYNLNNIMLLLDKK